MSAELNGCLQDAGRGNAKAGFLRMATSTRTLAGLLCAMVLFAVAGWRIAGQIRGGSDRAMLSQWERTKDRCAYALGRMMGEFLGEHYPHSRILVVHYAGDPAREEVMAALGEGLAGRAEVHGVVLGAAPANPTGSGDGVSSSPRTFRVSEFQQIVAQNPCDILVSYPGLPMDPGEEFLSEPRHFWQLPAQGMPKLVVIDSPVSLWRISQDPRIAAVISMHPTYRPSEDKAQGSYREVFNRRYVLIHAANVKETARDFPSFFGSLEPPK